MLSRLAFLLLLSLSLQQTVDRMDLRENARFTNCPSIREVHYEGICSSSWAITVATVASDEACAANSTKYSSKRISYQNIMECCSSCYLGYENGCYGGSFVKALEYMVSVGSVTGSTSDSSGANNCRNYRLTECYYNPDQGKQCDQTPEAMFAMAVQTCSKTCSNTNQNYTTDIIKASSAPQISFTSGNYADAMRDRILAGNIVITEMIVFEDLYSANPDIVYIHLYGRSIGTLTVAILGFAKDSNTNQEYWIVRVPWGKSLGNGGIIRVQKGTNNCGIENPGNAYYITFPAV